MRKDDRFLSKSIGDLILFVIAFILGGAGLGILYNSQSELTNIVGGFALIGIAIAIIYKLIQNG